MQPKAPGLAKPKLYRLRASSPHALFASRNCVFILMINWLLQGIRGMDGKELGFRGILEAGLALLIGAALATGCGIGLPAAIASGLLLAHSINFLANGQFWVCLRYCPAYRLDPALLARRLDRLLDRVAGAAGLEEAVLIGSAARGPRALGPRSDIDLRLIFPPGIGAWLRTNLLLLELRARAFVGRLPLDVYAYDHPAALRRFDQAEPLGIVLDRRARLRRGFANRQLVWLRR